MAFTGLFDIAGLANAFIEKQVAARKVRDTLAGHERSDSEPVPALSTLTTSLLLPQGPGSGYGQAPSKLEHLFGCSSCSFSEVRGVATTPLRPTVLTCTPTPCSAREDLSPHQCAANATFSSCT